MMTGPKVKRSKLPMVMTYIGIFALLATLAMVREGRLMGHKFTSSEDKEAITSRGGSMVINTTDLCDDVTGYGGPVPMMIYVTDGVIDSITPLPNSESEEFFGRVRRSGLLEAWNGKSVAEAAKMKVDGVTGATYSSMAVIANVRAGAAYAAHGVADAASDDQPLSAADTVKWIVALAVIIGGAVIPLVVKNKRYRLVQQILNVAVLGFWAGTFIDYAMMVGFFANGITITLASVVTIVLLVVGLIFPLFGRHGHYCAWVCPYGSLQELAGRIPAKRLKIGPKAVKALDTLRQALWVVLLSLLLIGWGAGWIDHEIFTGFFIKSAAVAVIVVGVLFIVLSVFVPRSFCRFVCPTGTLLKYL